MVFDASSPSVQRSPAAKEGKELLGIHGKPCGILNTAGYFDALIEFLDHAVAEGFLLEDHRSAIMVESDPRALLERLRAWEPKGEVPLMGRTNR